MKKKSIFGKTIKWTFIVLFVLIAAIAAAPFIFKDKIIQLVKDEANKNLNAKVDFGEFDLTLFSSFPDFTFKINNVSVANTGEFEGDTLFSVKKMELSLNLMSVIKGEEMKIRTILLDNPRIYAHVFKNGKANWDITKPSSDTTAPDASAESSKFKMSLKKLELINARIVYDDASLAYYMLIDGMNHTLSGDFTESNFDLDTKTSIEKLAVAYEGVKYMNNVKTTINAMLSADMPNFKFTFKENEIALNELSFGVDGYFAMPGDDMDMDLKLKVNQSEFKNFLSLVPAVYTADFANVKTSGKFGMNAYVKGIYNDKKMPAFGADLSIADAMFHYPGMPASVNNINVNVTVDNKTGDPDATVTDIKKFHIEMAGNPVDMVMHIETPVSDPFINGMVNGKIDLGSIKTIVPMEKDESLNGIITANLKLNGKMSYIEKEMYDKFEASGQLNVKDMDYKSKDVTYGMMIKSMTLNFSPQFVELASFDSKIGKSDIQANGKVENFMQYYFKNELLKGTFNMTSSFLDLNEFMTSSDEANSASPESAPASDTAAMAVIEVPSNIDFVMNSKIGKLKYDNIDISNVAGMLTIRDSKVDLNNLSMQLLGGSMVMNGFYETKDITKPNVNFKMDIKDFDIPQTYKSFVTIQKLAPVGQNATGRFSTNMGMIAVLDGQMNPIMSTLTGDGKLQTNAVSVSGFGPLLKIADALKMDKFKKMDFSNLNLSFKFKDGRVHVDPFDFKSGKMNGVISGSNGFDQTIDYTYAMTIPRSEFGSQANQVLNGMVSQLQSKGVNYSPSENVNIDALIGGTVTNPTVKTNLKQLATSAKDQLVNTVKEKVEEKKEEIIKDVKNNLNEQKQKILADAQQQADKVKQEATATAEKVRKEGYAQADNLEKSAKNPIEKVAAKKAAEKLRKETDEKANKIISEGNKKADDIMKAANDKANSLK